MAARQLVDWDVELVLDFYASEKFTDWSRLSVKELTLKTVFLLALASGKRRSELHALSAEVRWVEGDTDGVELAPVPAFVSKTQVSTDGLGALKPFVVPALQSEEEKDRLLCPVATLAKYLERTAKFRSPSQKRLIISHRQGAIKDITQQTLSCYMKEAILLAYQDPSVEKSHSQVNPKPHSIRHVATSLNALKGFKLDDVLRAGAWANPNTFLRFYVQSYSTDKLSKLSRFGGFVAAGAVV